MLRILSFVLLLSSLAACGGGGGDSSVSTPPTPNTPTPTIPLVFPTSATTNPHFYRWTQVSPKGSGAWNRLAIDPKNSNTRYVAIESTGGETSVLSKSSDAGKTWVRSDVGIQSYKTGGYGRSLTIKRIYDVMVHPTDSNIVYAASFGNGIYVSNDAGNSWQNYSEGLSSTAYDGYTLQALYIHPQDPERLFAFNHNNLVFSTNRGKTWQGLPVPEMTNMPTGFVFEGDHPNIFYITSYSDGAVKLHRTDDTGKTWQTRAVQVNNQTLSDSTYITHVLGGTLQNGKFKLFLGTANGLYTSSDQGNTWQAPLANTPEVQPIVAIAAEGANAYFSTTAAGQLYQLQPNGSWLQRNTGLPSMSLDYLKINPQQPQEVYISSKNQNTAFNSSDAGETWEWVAVDKSANKVLTGAQFSHVLYANNQRMLFYSVDYGYTWKFLSRNFLAYDTDISTVTVAQDRIYLYTNKEGRIYTSADKGDTWKAPTPLALLAYPNYAATAYYFVVSPSDPKQVYLSVVDYLFKSEDGGDTWLKQEEGLTHGNFLAGLYPYIAKVLFAPSNNSYLLTTVFSGDFVGLQTALFMRAAQTWQRIAPSVTDAYDIFIGGKQGEILYALSAKTDAYTGVESFPLSVAASLLKSTDQGQTWQTTGLTQTVAMYGTPSDYSPLLRVAIDPKDANHLYAVFVTQYPSQTLSSTQILHSVDAGQTWTPISLLNEPISSQNDKVYTLAEVKVAHPSDGTTGTLLYINTNTGGYRLDLPF